MVKTGQTWSGLVVCKGATGALVTPSVGPAGALYVNGVVNSTATVSVSGSNPYKWSCTLPTLTAGDAVSMYITATISTIATASVVAEDIGDTVRLSDGVTVTSIGSNVVNSTAVSASAVTEIQSGLSTLTAANVNSEVVDALTVDVLADSVATDGSRPTIGQALLMITRFLMERSVSSTTVTVKKEDGATTSMTLTLNDATSPTSITRAS